MHSASRNIPGADQLLIDTMREERGPAAALVMLADFATIDVEQSALARKVENARAQGLARGNR